MLLLLFGIYNYSPQICFLPDFNLGYSVNVPQNKMAYEVIMVCHLHMPFFIAILLCFLKNSIRQDMTLRKKPGDLF